MKLSVVIPALNEADALPRTLDMLRAHVADTEVIVVDAGCVDDTVAVARAHELDPRVLQPGGLLTRGAALNAGAAVATGDTLWFLHADTLPAPGHVDMMAAALSDPEVIGGAFEFGFSRRDWRLRIVEVINRLRYRVRGRFYGDQGIFVRRDIFEQHGGFEEHGLLEDAHLCRDLRRLGRLVLIRSVLSTSPRRFLEGGVFTVLWLDVRIWWLDLFGHDVQRHAEEYRAPNLRP